MDKNLLMDAMGEIEGRFVLSAQRRLGYAGESARYSSHHTKPVRKGFLIAAVIALALALAGFAVYKLLVSDVFGDYFGELDDSQIAVMEEIGSTEIAYQACQSMGTTIRPLAILADPGFCYLKLQIEAPEGRVLDLPEKGYYQIASPDDDTETLSFDGDFGGYEIALDWLDERPGDSQLELVIRISIQYLRHLDFPQGRPESLKIHNIWLEDENHAYSVILEGQWEFDLGRYFVDYTELSVKGLTATASDGACLTLQDMVLSPLGLGWYYTIEGGEGPMASRPEEFCVVLKDGSIAALELSGSTEGSTMFSGHARFRQPMNLEDVDHVRFGDLTIPVKGSA